MIDEHVQSICAKLTVFVKEWNGDFATNATFSFNQLPFHCEAIREFQESIAEVVINLEESTDYRLSDAGMKQVAVIHVES